LSDRLELVQRRRGRGVLSLAPVRRSCGAENGDGSERHKDRGENGVIRRPSDGCAEQRQGGKQNKVAGLGVHFRSRLKGAAIRLPLPLCAS
jgi:hypothetical protein